jgi:replicative DNA helicase
MNHTPPHDLELEKAVLGCVILDNRLGATVCGDVSVDSFYDTRNRVIFDAVRQLVEASEPVDAVTVHGRLSEAAKKADGMVAYLSTLTDSVATIQRLESYIAKLKELERHRNLICTAAGIAEKGYSATDTVDYIKTAREEITKITDNVEASSFVQVKEVSGDVYDELLSNDPPRGLIKTGIHAIDSEYGGLWPGVVTMLAARPSMGKSALALTILANAALAQKKVLFFSLEDTKEMVVRRLFARFADINSHKLLNRSLNFEEIRRLEGARDIINCLPITIDDTSAYNAQTLRGRIQRQIDTEGVDLLVIDHLDYIDAGGDGVYERTTAKAKAVTQIIRDLKLPNIVLHQLNRQNTTRPDKMPALSDLRGSGDIEQLIRVAWFLHREHYYDKDQGDENEATLLIAKNSHGPTGSIGLHCDLSRMHFCDKQQF